MKAEERKEIETNSLIHAVQKLRQHVTGRTLYYAIGTTALVIGAILVYRYLTREKSKARDAGLMQLINADTPEKLKQGMEDHRGTMLGSTFKLHLARHDLLNEGLPRLGTDRTETRKQAAASIEQARAYYLELTGELKQKDEPAMVQEAWLGAAQAEEALVGLPTAEAGNDSRGNIDKAIEYYEKAASIFPDSEFSKRHKAWADKIKANKVQFVAAQKEIYKPREVSPFGPPTKGDPFGSGLPGFPGFPKMETPDPKIEPPPVPSGPKIEVPPIPKAPEVPAVPDPKKSSEPPKPADPPKVEPKAK